MFKESRIYLAKYGVPPLLLQPCGGEEGDTIEK